MGAADADSQHVIWALRPHAPSAAGVDRDHVADPQPPVHAAEPGVGLHAAGADQQVPLDLVAAPHAEGAADVRGQERTDDGAVLADAGAVRTATDVGLEVRVAEGAAGAQRRFGHRVRRGAALGGDVTRRFVGDLGAPEDLPEVAGQRRQGRGDELGLGVVGCRVLVPAAGVEDVADAVEAVGGLPSPAAVDPVALVADGGEQVGQERLGRPAAPLERRQQAGEDLGDGVVGVGTVVDQRPARSGAPPPSGGRRERRRRRGHPPAPRRATRGRRVALVAPREARAHRRRGGVSCAVGADGQRYSAAGSSRLTFWKKKYRATTNGTMPTSAPTQLRRTRRLSSHAPMAMADSDEAPQGDLGERGRRR